MFENCSSVVRRVKMENYEKTGYLKNDFRIFHLKDARKMEQFSNML